MSCHLDPLLDEQQKEKEKKANLCTQEEKKKAKKGISFGVTEVAEIDEDGKVIKMGEMETKKGKRKKKKKKRDVPDGAVATTDIDATTPKKKMTMAEYSKAMRKRTLEVI